MFLAPGIWNAEIQKSQTLFQITFEGMIELILFLWKALMFPHSQKKLNIAL